MKNHQNSTTRSATVDGSTFCNFKVGGLSFRFCFNLEQSFWIVNNVAYRHGMTKKDVGFLL